MNPINTLKTVITSLLVCIFPHLSASIINTPSDSVLIIQENETGVASYEGSIDSNNPGYTGTGFINTENASGKGITWEVCAPDTGEYKLEWRYAHLSSGDRTAKVLVNGMETVAQVNFPSTWSWSNWDTTAALNVTLINGPNLIRLEATNKDGLPNIDYMSVAGDNPQAGFCEVAASGVLISPKEVSVGVKGIQQLTAQIIPANATNQNVSWRSADTSIATVNADGNLRGLKEGETRIMVSTEFGSFTDTCSVSVITLPLYFLETSVKGGGSITPASDSIAEGSMVCLTALPAEGWRFAGWSGDTTGKENPLCISMDSSISLTANFSEIWGHVAGFGGAAADGYAGFRGTTGGGTTSPVIVTTPAEFRAAVAGNSPAVIIVDGYLNVGSVSIGSNKTIAGLDEGSGLHGGTIGIQGTNCIIQNLNIGPANGDVMELSGATNVFITKCSMHDAGDEILSIVREADYVTVSWCRFFFNTTHDHAFGHLIGNSDDRISDRGKLHVTMHHNYYGRGIQGRQPRVRFGHVHIYNNYYNSKGSGYCIGVGKECNIRLESTVFQSVSNPWANYGGALNGKMGWHGIKLISSPLPTFVRNSFPVFDLPYSYVADPVDSVMQRVLEWAGNVFAPQDSIETIHLTLTSPEEGMVFGNNEIITLGADASIAGGSIDSIEFYANHALIGVSRGAPFIADWEDAPGGNFMITAKAYDRQGNSSFSDIVNIVVQGGVGIGDTDVPVFSLYPSPAKEILTIHLEQEQGKNAVVRLFNSQGKNLRLECIQGGSHLMDIKDLPAGIYMIALSSGQAFQVRKFVKE